MKNALMTAGMFLFILGGSIDAEPGAPLEWVPYAMMAAGLLVIFTVIVLDEMYYFGG